MLTGRYITPLPPIDQQKDLFAAFLPLEENVKANTLNFDKIVEH